MSSAVVTKNGGIGGEMRASECGEVMRGFIMTGVVR